MRRLVSVAAHLKSMCTFTESQHPRGQAGKFTTKAKAGAGVSLEPPETYPTSEDRPDAQDYSFPPGKPRHLALTAYDDETGTYTLGNVLEVSAPVGARGHWIDEHLPVLSMLRAAGVHGHLDVSSPDSPYGDGSRWEGRLCMPSGGWLSFTNEGSIDGLFGGSNGLWVSKGPASLEWMGTEEDSEKLHETLASVVRTASIEDGAFQRVRALSSKPTQVSSPMVSDREDGRGQLRGLVETGGYGFAVTFDVDGGTVDPPSVYKDRQPAGVEGFEAWALMARKAGVMGGRKARAPQRLREALRSVVADVDEHPNMAWVKEAYVPHTYEA